jgi:hypothetical protein
MVDFEIGSTHVCRQRRSISKIRTAGKWEMDFEAYSDQTKATILNKAHDWIVQAFNLCRHVKRQRLRRRSRVREGEGTLIS